MDLEPLANLSRAFVQKWLAALRGQPGPWADELERWLLAWHARVLQAAHSTGERQAHALRTAREAAGVVRGLLPLAPAEAGLDPAETDRALEDWLARAAAFETAAQPTAVAGPGVVDGLAQQALQQLHQQGHGVQPNSAHCFVCGLRNPYGLKMRFLQIAPDRVRAYAVVPEVYQGYPGVVHGGILAAMMDEVTGRAASGTDPATARLFYTMRLTLRYRHNTPTRRLLRLEGWVVKDKGRVVTAQGAIYDDATDQRLVDAEALLMSLPPEALQNLDPEALGWKIYPLDA